MGASVYRWCVHCRSCGAGWNPAWKNRGHAGRAAARRGGDDDFILVIDTGDINHIKNVFRKVKGDKIRAVDGTNEYLCEIEKIEDKEIKLKILEKISFSNGVSKYHLRQSVDGQLHHHLICTSCNTIEKVSNPIFNKLIEYMKKEYSFEVQDNSLSFYGTCAKCKTKGDK